MREGEKEEGWLEGEGERESEGLMGLGKEVLYNINDRVSYVVAPLK